MARRVDVIRLRGRSGLALALATVIGLAGFGWPFFVAPGAALDTSHSADAPWFFVALLPLLAGIVLAELSEGGLDAKAVALLGMLAAVGAALRALSPGAAGLEPAFLVILLGGRVFGRGFGFVLGALTIFTGALITGGVGPWMPFQMFAAGWIGFGAGCLPRLAGRTEVWALAAYAMVAGLAYGFVINLWFWPFFTFGTELAFEPGAPIWANLHTYSLFWVVSSLGWDLVRGVLNAGLILLAGAPLLAALRRTARRAAFEAPVRFVPPPHQDPTAGSDPQGDPQAATATRPSDPSVGS